MCENNLGKDGNHRGRKNRKQEEAQQIAHLQSKTGNNQKTKSSCLIDKKTQTRHKLDMISKTGKGSDA